MYATKFMPGRFFLDQEQIKSSGKLNTTSFDTKKKKKRELFCKIGDFSLEATVEGLYIMFCTINPG